MFNLTKQFLAFYFNAWERLGTFRIFSFAWWWDDVPRWLGACFLLWLLPIPLCVDLMLLFGNSLNELATLSAELGKPAENELRMAEADRARRAYQVDLAIAETIDDPDTREMAMQHAANKLHRRLAEIMGE